MEIQVFDPKQEFAVVERKLPHRAQAGTITFITWRTWDSISADVLAEWIADRDTWLKELDIDPKSKNWRQRLRLLETKTQKELLRRLSDRWNDHLDDCHGECVLQRQQLAQIVADSLSHFDGVRYELTDFVIMPNHVHVLAAFPDEASLLQQCDSWKHFTALQINKSLARTGRFWQQDGFDHLVRSGEQYVYLRDYIADNPQKARLRPGQFLHWSKAL